MKSFDLASTTAVDDDVLNTYLKAVKQFNTHPDSDPYLVNLRNEVKQKMQNLLHINHHICFTSGGTESNNLAIIGLSKNYENKKHFITSTYEHPSVLNCFKYLESIGHQVTYLNPNHDGVITPSMVVENLATNTVLVSIMSVNNEIGSMNDIEAISDAIKAVNPHIYMMSDCVQGITHIDLNVLDKLDIFTISAHKLHGLKGCGLVAFKDNVHLKPILYGGHNENGLRPGTQDLARELSFCKAVEKYVTNHQTNVVDYLIAELEKIKGINFNTKSHTHIVNVSIPVDMMAESIKTYLYDHGFMTSTKSACASMADSRSLTLQAIGIDDDTIDHSIRISIDANTTKADVDELITTLQELINN